MKKVFRPMKWLMLISGVVLAILGITMLFTPSQSLTALVVFIGIAMLISGVSEIVSFCCEERSERSGWMLASGIISALLGIWVMFGRGSAALAAIIPFIFAIWIMTSSIIRIVGSVSLGNEGFAQWGWVLALGLVGAILGFTLLFSPLLSSVVVVYAIAAMLIAYGVNNILIFFRVKRLGEHIRRRMEGWEE